MAGMTMTEQQDGGGDGSCIIKTVIIAGDFDIRGIVVGGSGGCGDRKDVPEYVTKDYDTVVEEL